MERVQGMDAMKNYEAAKKTVLANLNSLFSVKYESDLDVTSVRKITQICADYVKGLKPEAVANIQRKHFGNSAVAYSEMQIDYTLIADALDYFQEEGFTRLELPRDVPGKYCMNSFPSFYEDRTLIDSGASAFKFLIDSKMVKRGYYVSATPYLKPVQSSKTVSQSGMFLDIFHYGDGDIELMKKIVKNYMFAHVKIFEEGNFFVDANGDKISEFVKHSKFSHISILQEPHFSNVTIGAALQRVSPLDE